MLIHEQGEDQASQMNTTHALHHAVAILTFQFRGHQTAFLAEEGLRNFPFFCGARRSQDLQGCI